MPEPKKIAFFVEGKTELLLVEKLLEIASARNSLIIESKEIRGGSTVPRTMTTIRAASSGGGRYYAMILDCGGDDQVKTRIREEHSSLTAAGYAHIVGVRDVYPGFKFSELPRLERGLMKHLNTALAPVTFILAVMEVEAWFLAETTHFARIDTRITLGEVAKVLGCDPITDDLQQVNGPADALSRCYGLVGKAYTKSKVKRTVDAIDFAELYINVAERFPHLKRMVGVVERFLFQT